MAVGTTSLLGSATGAAREIEERFGAEVALCYQCKRCTSGCPAADSMEFGPHQIVRMVRLGAADRPIGGEAIWNCVGCYTCTTRCPQSVPITEMVYSLKGMAIREGRTAGRAPVPAFLKAFASTVERHGRDSEFEMLVRYFLSTNPRAAIAQAPIGMTLFRQGRLPLLPHRVRGWKALKSALRKARRRGGKG